MALDTAIDITAAERETILALLQQRLPGTVAWVYGSRAKGTSTPKSDLDLVVFATPKQGRHVGELREAFEESNLPFRVDLFVWDDVPESFRERIEAKHVVLWAAPKARPSAPSGVAGEWIESTLGRVADFLSGGTPTRSRAEYWDGSIPWISAKDMKRFRLADTQDHVTDAGRDNGTRLVPEGTVLLLARGMTLINDVPICVAQRPVTFNQDVKALRAKPPVASAYLPYLLLGNKHRLLSLVDLAGHGTGRLNSDELKALDVVFPKRPEEQRAIAHILGTLDDKIELNRRMNATLESMARALFKSWFVDFDPVRAKMEGLDTGLPKEVADLFPDRLVDSELGEIPEDWEVSEIGTEVDAVGGATPSTKKPTYWDGGQHYWATPKDLSKLRSPVLLDTDRKITDAGAQKISSGLLPPGTVLLSSRAPIGYMAITEVPTAVNQGFIAMICRKRLPALHVLRWCFENLEHIKGISGGSTFAEISKKAFRPLPVVVPPKAVLGVYDAISNSLHGRVVSNAKESRLLASCRDLLLPKLVCGDFRARFSEL